MFSNQNLKKFSRPTEAYLLLNNDSELPQLLDQGGVLLTGTGGVSENKRNQLIEELRK